MTDAPRDIARESDAPVTADADAAAVAPPAAMAPPSPDNAPEGSKSRTRKRAFLILGLVVLVAAIAYGIYAFFLSPPTEETEDAYVAGDVVSITARDPGTVTAIYADDTERVEAGQPLIDLDPDTADVELEAAAAQLARAVRNVRGNFSDVNAGRAAVVQAEAELARARSDLSRRQEAAAQGAVSGEEVSHAADTVKTAAATLNVARSRLAQSQSQVAGTDIRSNPAVLAAIAAYRQAAIRRSHMHITAPIDGVVAKRGVQVGQQVAAGTPLMAVVPLGRVWVDANFRETQLADLRVGQPATITTDTYGGDVVFTGHVLGLGAGSGSAFALLPPQNASGNWIKIVQRVPVRIGIDPGQLDEHPLRIGLSVTVEVDTADTSGSLVAREAAAPYERMATDSLGSEVDGEIARIIAENSGRAR